MVADLGTAVSAAAALVTATALLLGIAVLVRTRSYEVALPVFLDLLTTAGLLRLASPDQTWATLGTATLVLAVRRTALSGLAAGRRARARPPPRVPSAARATGRGGAGVGRDSSG